MTDKLHRLAGQMVALFRQAVPLVNAEVDAIIQSGERDSQRIEHQLDHMLGLCCDPDMLVVFKRLCRYYFDIDPVATTGYPTRRFRLCATPSRWRVPPCRQP
jgi:hypothetical protein